MDLDLAFSHKKRGEPICRTPQMMSRLRVLSSWSSRLLLSLCLSLPVSIVYLLLLGQLSPKHKRSSKQVNDGMFLLVVRSSLHDCDAPPSSSMMSSHTCSAFMFLYLWL